MLLYYNAKNIQFLLLLLVNSFRFSSYTVTILLDVALAPMIYGMPYVLRVLAQRRIDRAHVASEQRCKRGNCLTARRELCLDVRHTCSQSESLLDALSRWATRNSRNFTLGNRLAQEESLRFQRNESYPIDALHWMLFIFAVPSWSWRFVIDA